MEAKDKRVKREIANSNERRRMQSINAGFQKLKRLLPVNEGEKMSKAAILQHAADFVMRIEREKLLLFEQNTHLRSVLSSIKNGTDVSIALKGADLDSLPTIQVNPHIDLLDTNESNMNNNSNSSSSSSSCCTDEGSTRMTNTNDRNSNDTKGINTTRVDDCIRNNNKDIQRIGTRNGKREAKNNVTTNSNTSNSNNNVTKSGSIAPADRSTCQELTNQQISSVADIISDRNSSPKNGMVPSGIAKAAIALPLEVPYISETIIRVDSHHHDMHSNTSSPPARKILKSEVTAINPQDSAPKGQNLDTICKAIMEIEGDRVFRNERIKEETT